MGRHVCTFAILVLSVVVAADAHHTSRQATRHGDRVRADHKMNKANPVASKATRQSASQERPLVTFREISIFQYDFGDDGTLEREMIADGRYDPKMVLPHDVTVDDFKRNRIIVTTPLLRHGIPVTIAAISLDEEGKEAHKPYPNLEIHHTTEDTITDCINQLVDVVTTMKTWADDDTLYAIDNGVLDMATIPKNACPPKIVTFDLLTDEIISTTVIENAACDSLYTFLWVDACPDGGLTAYISDSKASVLTVTDLSTGTSKHLQSQYFHPKPGFFFIKAGGPAYYMPHGLWGVTAEQNCDGKVYFQALATNVQGAVDKQVIREARDGDILDIKTQVDLPGEISGPSGEMVIDPTGQLLFFPGLDKEAVYCWNTTKPHNPENFLMMAQDSERLEFVSSMTVDTRTQRLYLLSNRFTYYLSNATNYSEENYRLLYINIQDIEC